MRERFWLEEVIEQCRLAERFARETDQASIYAMLKATENVWEAAKALPEEVLSRLFPDDEELLALRRTRDFYAHQYHRIDPDVARTTARRDLPRLATRATALLDEF